MKIYDLLSEEDVIKRLDRYEEEYRRRLIAHRSDVEERNKEIESLEYNIPLDRKLILKDFREYKLKQTNKDEN